MQRLPSAHRSSALGQWLSTVSPLELHSSGQSQRASPWSRAARGPRPGAIAPSIEVYLGRVSGAGS
eukprot:CAMPEP_0201206758 /NCGR_PEP_ID=MMETSP0851-20130426/173302_1 /ASSEMBLY_ACC=CAM_ASM_000631 /TAXON_ID=183588 /ORGANISM="Pseudo-nitzschia fraudulenta, Strain WWA7" /LENGTH=65 /DNA_ID=CAMNT_0047495135 /DNA_START=29 /DNA_END=223 /DNA_ORIENTATION=+